MAKPSPKSKTVTEPSRATDTSARLPRYVELVRVSGASQVKKDTPESQRQALERLRAQRAGVLVERIEALAVSAALPLHETDAGRRLIELAQRQAFDELRVFDLDRALGGRADRSRDRMAVMDLLLDAEAVLVDATGHVIDPADDEDYGEFEFFMRGYIGKKERAKIKKRTAAGRARVASQGGLAGGPPPYGRICDRATKQWSLDPEEHPILQRMIALALNGMAARRIALALNAERVPSPRGGLWGPSTVIGILRSRSLIGELEHAGVRFTVAPIIDRGTFDRVQRNLDARKVDGRPPVASPALLHGRVRCSACGSKCFVRRARGRGGRDYYYYRCRTGHADAGASGLLECRAARVNHPVRMIDPAVWIALCDALDQDDRQLWARLAPKEQDVVSYESQVAACEKKLAALARAEEQIDQRFYRSDAGPEATARWQAARDGIERDRATLVASRDAAREIVAQASTTRVDRVTWTAAIGWVRRTMRELGTDTPIEVQRDVVAALIPAAPGYGVEIAPDGSIEICGGLRTEPQAPGSIVGKVSNFR